MKPEDYLATPFLNRDHLSFKHGTTFQLRVTSQATGVATLSIRGLTREGLFTFKQVTTSNGLSNSANFPLPDLPIIVSVVNETPGFLQGECYVSLALLLNGDRIFELCSGLVYVGKGISYPATNSEYSITGRGNIKTVTTADPAAGAEISLTLGNGIVWHVLAMAFTLVTSATVGSRRVHVRFVRSGPLFFEAFPSIDQTASQTIRYSCAKYGAVPDELDNNVILVPIPHDIWLIPEDVIDTATLNLKAGDDFGVGTILVEEFFREPI